MEPGVIPARMNHSEDIVMNEIKNIGILGAGTWGVALARLLERNGHAVTVWSKFPQEVEQLSRDRAHPNLPGLIISPDIAFTCDM